MDLAPIILFVYNRPIHTLKTLEALRQNRLADQSVLYIFADGPKENATPESIKLMEETRAVIRKEQWCKEVHFRESFKNRGLANSIVEGVTEIVNAHNKVIVLEDDIVPSPGFLQYMNDALSLYEHENRVAHISGYNYPLIFNSRHQTMFINILSCWGWGTWKRAWKYYNHNIDDHIQRFSQEEDTRKFNIEGNADFYRQLLMNKEKRIYSWAVRWYASWLSQNMFSLFPKESVVVNIGHDGTGVHSAKSNIFGSVAKDSITVEKIPLEEDRAARQQIDRFYQTTYREWVSKHLKRKTALLTKIKRLRLYKISAWIYRAAFQTRKNQTH